MFTFSEMVNPFPRFLIVYRTKECYSGEEKMPQKEYIATFEVEGVLTIGSTPLEDIVGEWVRREM